MHVQCSIIRIWTLHMHVQRKIIRIWTLHMHLQCSIIRIWTLLMHVQRRSESEYEPYICMYNTQSSESEPYICMYNAKSSESEPYICMYNAKSSESEPYICMYLQRSIIRIWSLRCPIMPNSRVPLQVNHSKLNRHTLNQRAELNHSTLDHFNLIPPPIHLCILTSNEPKVKTETSGLPTSRFHYCCYLPN
jgi:hypothetical protein